MPIVNGPEPFRSHDGLWQGRRTGQVDMVRSSISGKTSVARTIGVCAAILIGVSLTVSGCTKSQNAFEGTGSPRYEGPEPIPYGGGVQKIGNPYQIAGRTYTPHADPDYDKTGIASWYGDRFHRRRTANGEWFDMNRLTAAHPTLPLPVYARVTNRNNNRSIVVRINDRGPYAHDRIIDLSRQSATELGFRQQGTAPVRVEFLGPAPLNDDGSDLVAMNERYRGSGAPATQLASVDTPTVAERGRNGSSREDDRGAGTHNPARTNFATAPRGTGAASSSAPVAAGNGYFVQAAAFSDRGNAVALHQRLSSLGKVEIAESNLGSRTLYRVRVGPLADSVSADQALQNVIAAGQHDAHIVAAN